MTIPGDATKVHLDAATDDPKQARAELADFVDKFNTLKAHLAAIEIVAQSLGIGQGLENNANTTLQAKLDANSGLVRDANGLGLNIASLTAETAPAIGDLLALDDVSVGAGPKRRGMTLENMLKVINGLTADASPATGDFVVTYDVSAGGAKKVTRSNFTALAAASVAQAQLKTTTHEISTSSNFALTTMNSGSYGFYWEVRYGASQALPNIGAGFVLHQSGNSYVMNTVNIGTSYTTLITIGTNNAPTVMFARQRYVQASPPYDLGDGEIPLFAYALVRPNGSIESVSVAPEPPWAHNGPTDIVPTRTDPKTGKQYRRRMVLPSVRRGLNDAARREELLAALQAPQFEDVEITQAVKNQDMPLLPQPWQFMDTSGRTVVLLDPVADITHKLLRLHESPDRPENESVNALLHDDYLRLDNTPLVRAGPPGVMACRPRWK